MRASGAHPVPRPRRHSGTFARSGVPARAPPSPAHIRLRVSAGISPASPSEAQPDYVSPGQNAKVDAAYDPAMEIARMYLDAQRSFLAFVEPLGAEGWNRPVPCTPGWTVRDVLSHQAGLSDDVLNGRTDGAGSDPWTGAQVERWRGTDTTVLIEQWRQQGPQLADMLERFNQLRPVFDVNTHEHDVRHALGLPGNRASELVGVMAAGFASAQFARPITIEFEDGTAA